MIIMIIMVHEVAALTLVWMQLATSVTPCAMPRAIDAGACTVVMRQNRLSPKWGSPKSSQTSLSKQGLWGTLILRIIQMGVFYVFYRMGGAPSQTYSVSPRQLFLLVLHGRSAERTGLYWQGDIYRTFGFQLAS